MKLCDVTQFYSPVGGGVRRYVTEKRNYIQQSTQDEHLLIVPAEKTEVIRDGRLILCTIASPPISKTSRYRILLNLRQVEAFLKAEKPDLIESGDPYHLAWKAIDVGMDMRVPAVGFYHSHFPEAYLRTIFKYGGSWLRDVGMAYAQDYIVKLYNRFTTTLVPSKFLAQLLAEWGVLNAVPVHLGIDETVFYPAPPSTDLRQELGIPQEAFLILYVGRLAGEKNTPTLLQSIEWLHQRYPDRFHFLILGDGLMRGDVLDLKKSIPTLHWLSYCQDSRRLADFYRSANLFVHPGVCETFGLVTLESQACGCPVVGIRGSYMDVHVAEGLNAWADDNTPESLAQAIVRFSEEDLKAMGMRASEKIIQNYRWSRVFQDLWKHYQQAIQASLP
jgi:alpha-1,6-mannosyltransferase